jgi:hypothetical protein
MAAAFFALMLFAVFGVAFLVGFFVGLYFFLLCLSLERERVYSLGPVWAFWRAWSYRPCHLTVRGQRILPKWRKAMIALFACLVLAPLSVSIALWLTGKTNPLFGGHASKLSFQATSYVRS